MDRKNLTLEVETGDFVTYLGKSVTLEIGIKGTDLDTQIASSLIVEVNFLPPKLEFEREKYTAEKLECNEKAASWSLRLPPIKYEDELSVKVELLKSVYEGDESEANET